MKMLINIKKILLTNEHSFEIKYLGYSHCKQFWFWLYGGTFNSCFKNKNMVVITSLIETKSIFILKES